MELAKNGLGNTYPNPMVGCVIVHQGKIIGEGWHYKSGQPHAEVNAINAVADKLLLKTSELYVNLEPCSHHGKTPPCANLITKYNIPKVIIGALDSNEVVSGKGVAHLENNGCDVTVGVLEKECLDLNKRFYTYHNKQRPYVILKWAASADGFIAKKLIENQKREPVFITNTASLQMVHQWRAEEQAILVGTHTAVADNPKLDVRHSFGNNPIRVVLDRALRIPKDSHIFDTSVKTIVITDKSKVSSAKSVENLIFEGIDFAKSVPQQICDVLYRHKIQSVLIEGGAQTLQSFIDVNLWDEARVFEGKIMFKSGVNAPSIKGVRVSEQNIKDDTLSILKWK